VVFELKTFQNCMNYFDFCTTCLFIHEIIHVISMRFHQKYPCVLIIVYNGDTPFNQESLHVQETIYQAKLH